MNKRPYTQYKNPFCKGYWKDASSEFLQINRLIIASLLTVIGILLEEYCAIWIIPLTLKIAFSYVAISLCSLLTGPLVAIICGIISDVVGALLSGYSFYPGYTVSAVLVAVIYALFLYRQKLTFTRILLSRLFVCVFVNVLLDSVWRCNFSGGFYLYYITVASIKNLLLLPFESFMIFIFFKSVMPALGRLGLVPRGTSITVEKKKIAIIAVCVALGVVLVILYSQNSAEINSSIKSFITSAFN